MDMISFLKQNELLNNQNFLFKCRPENRFLFFTWKLTIPDKKEKSDNDDDNNSSQIFNDVQFGNK